MPNPYIIELELAEPNPNTSVAVIKLGAPIFKAMQDTRERARGWSLPMPTNITRYFSGFFLKQAQGKIKRLGEFTFAELQQNKALKIVALIPSFQIYEMISKW